MHKKVPYILALTVFLASSSSLFAEDSPPRVLIIGDNVANMYAREVAKQLKGKVTVDAAVKPPEFLLNSSTIFQKLDQFLGRIDRNGKPVPKENWPAWDLIHINVGLGDLVHRVPNLKAIRLLPISAGGVVTTKPEDYEKNLDALIKQLKSKAPGAKIIWANTTPIRFSRNGVFKLGTEVEYNKIAERVMKKHRIPINDMYSYAVSIMNMDKPAGHGADPFHFDKKPLHPPVVSHIVKALGQPELASSDAARSDGNKGEKKAVRK